MKFATCLVGLGAALLSAAVFGQDAEQAARWSLSTGVARRSFDVEFQARPITNPAIGSSEYVNFATTGLVGDTTWQMMDPAVQAPVAAAGAPPSALVSVDSATLLAADENADSYGIFLGANRTWMQVNGFNLEWDLRLGLFGLDSDNAAAAAPGAEAGFATSNATFEIAAPVPGMTLPPSGNAGFPILSGPNAVTAGLANATISTDTSIDANILVLSGGLLASKTAGNWKLTLGGGPTLTIADTDSSYDQSITTGNRTDTYSEDDSATDFILGIYAALGVQYRITEAVSVGVAGRYDLAASEIKTKHADVDLDGHSFEIKAVWDF